MTGDAVKAIQQIIENNQIVEEGGRKYSRGNLKPIIFHPNIETLDIKTLAGIIDYLECKIDEFKEKVVIHIVDFNRVRIIGECEGPELKRNKYLDVKLREYENFPYGRFLSHEEFIIKLRSLFETTEDQLKLIAYTSKLTVDNKVTMTDDGCAQTAKVKKGVSGALLETETAPSIVHLKPYRTFREIKQPMSAFLFRIKETAGVPACTLFEADGERWKDEAVNNIAGYLQEEMKDKGINIPIIK